MERKGMRIGIVALTGVYAFALMLFCGADSPLRIVYPHVDSSWFFMGGKAWMEGLVPYSDFTDSKGPLLWLIYGLGYLISPNDFYGVFWIEVAFYWLTLLFLYKTARLLLDSAAKSLAAVFVSTFFLFLPVIHYEIRAEDFSLLFLAICAYALTTTYIRKGLSLFVALLAGISLGASLLIKFNVTALLCVPICFILVGLSKYQTAGYTTLRLAGILAGILIVILPFLLYFIAIDHLYDFINEYFVNTLSTVSGISGATGELPGGGGIFSNFVRFFFHNSWLGCVYKLTLLFVIYLPLRVYRSPLLRIAIWFWYLASLIMALSIIHEYYMAYIVPFCFFGIISLFSLTGRWNLFGSAITGALAVAAIVWMQQNFLGRGEFADVKGALKRNELHYRLTGIIREYSAEIGHTPTISYVYVPDRGEHIGSGALPGTKYWAYQNGSTPEMKRHNFEDVFWSRPDIVVVEPSLKAYQRRLEEAGYRILYADNEHLGGKIYMLNTR